LPFGKPLPVGHWCEKEFSMFKKLSAGYRNAGIALFCSLPVLAMAQGTDPFDAAVTSVTAKVNLYWPQLVGIAAIAVGFAIGMKYVRKIRGAA
jgi:hypothetical protein